MWWGSIDLKCKSGSCRVAARGHLAPPRSLLDPADARRSASQCVRASQPVAASLHPRARKIASRFSRPGLQACCKARARPGFAAPCPSHTVQANVGARATYIVGYAMATPSEWPAFCARTRCLSMLIVRRLPPPNSTATPSADEGSCGCPSGWLGAASPISSLFRARGGAASSREQPRAPSARERGPCLRPSRGVREGPVAPTPISGIPFRPGPPPTQLSPRIGTNHLKKKNLTFSCFRTISFSQKEIF